jgi:hypothetical protein
VTTFVLLEQQRADLLARVDAWPAAAVAFRPDPDAWSAAEVLDHLVRSERGILTVAERGLAAPHRRGVRDRVGVWFLDRVFRSDRRVRVPASAAAVVRPDRGADLAAVRREWDAARRDLARFLAPLVPGQLTVGVFRHPVAGWMRVPDVLRFFWVHAHHHGVQLARLRAAGDDRAGTPP